MDDSISRRVAINAVEKESQVDGSYGYMDTKSIVDLLNDLPSAQRWIPVSESLPPSREEVNVSVCDETGDTRYNYTSHGWLTTDKEYWIVDNEINNYVVAWMPLPEPWEGRR